MTGAVKFDFLNCDGVHVRIQAKRIIHYQKSSDILIISSEVNAMRKVCFTEQ